MSGTLRSATVMTRGPLDSAPIVMWNVTNKTQRG
jgi:hypothetical protein